MNNRDNEGQQPSERPASTAGAAPRPPEPAEEATTAAPDTATLTAEIASLNDRLMRALAEAENIRRQKDREIEEARKYAITAFARGLLEVADNLRRALAAVPGPSEGRDPLFQTLVLGVEMTERTLLALFERHKIRKVEPKPGDRFDPSLHQAMFEVPTTELAPGSIAEVLQPGYVLDDRLLRPALVGVAKAPVAPQAASQEPGGKVDTTA
ncbi:MAG: nucleotide exchange factor GrpE [Geminicoccaceae bacterium]|nr:nucleotide exchange factor GrpE [Geminicoccaceae bacterium]